MSIILNKTNLRAIRVIKSCKTYEQLAVAKTYCSCLARRLECEAALRLLQYTTLLIRNKTKELSTNDL